MPYKSQNTHLDIPALQPCDNLSPIAEKGVKQLCYHSCSIDMIINQRHTCKNLGDTFFSHFWEMKTWEIFWTSKIQNKIDGWKASTLENTRGMEQCRRNLKSLTAFDTCVYCQGAVFFFLPWGRENYWPFRKPATSFAQSSSSQLLQSGVIVKGDWTPLSHIFSFKGLLSFLLRERLGAERSDLSLIAPYLHYTVMNGEGTTPSKSEK